jgi:syntaxin 1B/2/3
MSVLVEQQDEQVTAIETTAAAVETDLEVGVQYTEKAVESARGARKKRWICFIIIIILVIIIAIIIVVKVVIPAVDAGKKDDGKTQTVTASATAAAAATTKRAFEALVTPTPPPLTASL